jgi:hypothetical protein
MRCAAHREVSVAKLRLSIGLSAVLALSPAAGSATSMLDLFNGASLNLPGVMIDGWSLASDVSSVAIDYDQIDVTAMFIDGQHFAIWYDFDDQLIVDNFDFIDIDFLYAIWSDRPIEDNLVYLTGAEFGDPASGLIQVYEDVFDENGILLATKLAEIDNLFGVNNPSDSAVFPGQYHLIIEKRIVLESDGDLVKLGDLHQEFSIPEPGTIAVMSFGLAAFAAGRRRRGRTV